MDRKRLLKIVLLFAVSYLVLYLLGLSSILKPWGDFADLSRLDYMYYLIPIPGFFFMYFTVDFLDGYLKDKTAMQWYFPVVFFLLSIPAYYLALFFYFANVASLSRFEGSPAELFNFWDIFKESAFLVFVLAALLGWVSRMVMETQFSK